MKSNEPTTEVVELRSPDPKSGKAKKKQESRKQLDDLEVDKVQTEREARLERWRKDRMMWDNVVLFCRVFIACTPPTGVIGYDFIFKQKLIELISILPANQSAKVFQEYYELLGIDPPITEAGEYLYIIYSLHDSPNKMRHLFHRHTNII